MGGAPGPSHILKPKSCKGVYFQGVESTSAFNTRGSTCFQLAPPYIVRAFRVLEVNVQRRREARRAAEADGKGPDSVGDARARRLGARLRIE